MLIWCHTFLGDHFINGGCFMNISSTFTSGLAGFQKASTQLDNASARIAQASIAGNSSASHESSSSSPISISTELINMKVAEMQAKASAKVIGSADDMLGTLIDTTV